MEGSNEVLQGEASKGEQTVTNGSQEECRVSNWKTVSPEKVGRSSPGHVSEVLISASKFSVLTVDEKEEVEEGEIGFEDQENNEDENLEDMEQLRVIEDDLLEDNILEHQSRGKDKAVMKKGLKRGPKVKVQDANPAKSTRLSRKKK